MEYRIKVRSSFVQEAVHKEFYTGGNVQVSNDGSCLFCQCRNYITIVNINSGCIRSIPSESDSPNTDEDVAFEDDILTFTLSNTSDLLASVHKSGLIKVWNWTGGIILKSWKSIHKGPVVKLAFNNANTHLATGGTDSSVRIWEIDTMSCICKLGGLQGVTSILTYHVVEDNELLFTSGNEAKIFVWSFHGDKHKQLIFNLSGHFSVITNLIFCNDGLHLVSCGRDKVIMVWNLTDGSHVRTLPLYESIETGTILPNCIHLPGYEKPNVGELIAVGGETGDIHIWNVLEGKELYKYSDDNEGEENPLVHLIYHEEHNCLISITADQTIVLYKLDEEFSVQKQLVGCNDEILDVAYIGEDESHLAVAVNSCHINLYDEKMNCFLLKGHKDLIISLCSSRAFPNVLVSGSKDNSIRVWLMNEGRASCIAVGSRHAASVNAVDISNVSSESLFIVSGSEDTTIKVWNLNEMKFGKEQQLNVSKTQIAHEKSINSVAISPNNKLIASGSQDKTAKLWSSTDLSPIGTLKGHRRGIWCVKFSPVDQVVLTSSADGSLRLWSVTSCTCLKTFEGHESSVLKCAFINKGTQIVSAGSDGLIKNWLIKTGECITTLDKHSGKIWALIVKSSDSQIVSGSSDSRLIIWRDNTEEELMKESNAKKELATQEQSLLNLLHADQLLPALQLTLTLERPGQALKIVENILSKESNGLTNIVTKLDTNQKETLLNYACSWNTNSKHCYAAQKIYSLLKDELVEGSIKLSDKSLEGALAYTDRHFKRITKLLQDVQLIEYTEKLMQPHAS